MIPPEIGVAPLGPAGFAPTQQPPPPAPPAPPGATPTTAVGPPTATTLPPGAPITTPRVTRLVPVESGTTVPPDVLDPRAPIPSTALTDTVIKC